MVDLARAGRRQAAVLHDPDDRRQLGDRAAARPDAGDPRAATPRQAWLDPATPPAELPEILAGLAAAQTALRAVGPAVNDARYDGPECLAPAARGAQAALF